MAEQKQFNPNYILKNLEEKYNKASADKKVSSSINIDPERVLTVAEAAQSLEKFGADGVRKFLDWATRFE